MTPTIDLGRYLRLKDHRHIWVLRVIPAEEGAKDNWPRLEIRRPRGAFHCTANITSRGFLTRHKKVRDNGL